MPAMENQLYDVIIVGRGPVGLFLACELLLQDVSVLVVERRLAMGLGDLPETRACIVHARTQEILAARGLLPTFNKVSSKTNWWHYGILETRLQFGALDDETLENHVMFTPQSQTEEILLRRALELGAVVQLGAKVKSLDQSADEVTLRGSLSKDTNGDSIEEDFTVRGKYVVGCDGWRSSVRELAKFNWEQRDATHVMWSAEATPGVDMGPFNITKNDAGILIMCKMDVPSGRSRIACWTPSRNDLDATEPFTLEEFNQALTEITGRDNKLGNPKGLARFTNMSGYVTEYRKGRVFLGGDAAHRHLPAGGQGMNLGIQEVNNLAWKLGAVIRGEAPDTLLDTYGSERLSIAQGVVTNTTAQSLLFFAHTRPETAIRESLNKILEVPEANRKLALEISGLSHAYPAPLQMIRPEGWDALPKELSGKRAPDVKVRTTEGDEKYLHDFLKGGKWVQFVFSDRNSTGNVGVPAFVGRTEVVSVAEILGNWGGMYKGPHSQILIRPDGHFGFGKL